MINNDTIINFPKLIKDIQKKLFTLFMNNNIQKTVNITSNKDKTDYYFVIQTWNGEKAFIRLSQTSSSRQTWEEWTELTQTPKEKVFMVQSIIFIEDSSDTSQKPEIRYLKIPYTNFSSQTKYNLLNIRQNDMINDIVSGIYKLATYHP